MANLYKPFITKTDPETGKKIKEKGKMWYGRYRDADGVEQRLPLAENKVAAQQMLAKLTEHVFRIKHGLAHPAEMEMKRPIEEHVNDFEKSLASRNNTKRYIRDTIKRIERCIKFCHWKKPSQIKATDVEKFLVDLRETNGCSLQTSNHYLRVLKGFCQWMYVNKRLIDNPLLALAMLNVRVDRRHDRRALTHDELMRLIDAAETGPPVQGLLGPDRAMLYTLAAWTGFRKGELGSLTPKSFDLCDEEATNGSELLQRCGSTKRLHGRCPTVTIEAGYSKHRRQDVQVLHPDLVAKLRKWLSEKKPQADEILFPISQAAGGVERAASKMMRFDLEAARTFWIAESHTANEESIRLHADYLLYRDENGKFADFHGLRHTFITNLGRAGVSPKTAQSLARHSDISLTMQIYTHVDQEEQIAAINALPSPEPKTVEEKPEDKKRPKRKPK